MSSFICPVCKEVNEEHRNYCKSCGNWLLSTNFPSKPLGREKSTNPKWLLIVQISIIILFALMALLTLIGSDKTSNSATYSVIIILGVIGLTSIIICWIIALFVKQARVLKKQLLIFPALYAGLMIYGLSQFDQTGSTQPTIVESKSVPSLDEFTEEAVTPNPRDLARAADSTFKGKKVHLKGTIVQVIGKNGDQLRVNLAEDLEKGSFKEPITIFLFRKDSAGTLLDGDEIELWGTVLGTQTYKAWTGVEITVPSVQSQYLKLVEEIN
ncbi:hypothetical protein [Cohnella soli]|uniref:Zinc ribbon domain-containing protein n=1 Tax=Cohnella soli TaxID=425005 RepID=A0ABW0HXZ7_9BACL